MQGKVFIIFGCLFLILFTGCSSTGKVERKATMEFRFRERDAYTVNGHKTPYTLWLPENSTNKIVLTIDNGEETVYGNMTVYKNNDFTRLCPVFVPIDAQTQEDLRGNFGEAKLTFYVPSEETRKSGLPAMIRAEKDKDPVEVAGGRGTVIAELKLWRVQK